VFVTVQNDKVSVAVQTVVTQSRLFHTITVCVHRMQTFAVLLMLVLSALDSQLMPATKDDLEHFWYAQDYMQSSYRFLCT